MSKTLIRSEAGVRLVEERDVHDGVSVFRLFTHRTTTPRLMSDRDESLAAFEHEVAIALKDPVVINLIQRGAI